MAAETTTSPAHDRHVVVTDIQMPFGSMVVFIIKWTLASIPAIILLMIVFAILSLFFGVFFGGLLGWLFGVF